MTNSGYINFSVDNIQIKSKSNVESFSTAKLTKWKVNSGK